jgi:hypothetical protein
VPHVQVVGDCPLETLRDGLAGFQAGTPPQVLKIRDCYLNARGTQLLLEAIVVEGYLRQGFFLLARRDEDGILIRCHPSSPVQKTDGVKALIARLGARCTLLCPGARIGNTNLGDYL